MSRWIEWVRKWAKDNNTTYGCALSEKDCSASYRAKYGISKKLPVKKEREMMGVEDVNRAKKKPKKLPKNVIIYEEEEGNEMDMMAKEDINRARKKPNREKKEAFSMASEDLLSKMTINKKTKKKPKKLPKNLIIYEEEEEDEMNMMAKEDINVARKKEILKKLSPLEKELKEINKKIENKKQFVEMSRMMGEDYNAPETYKTPVMERKKQAKKTRMKRIKDIVRRSYDDRIYYSNRFHDKSEAYGIVDGKVMIIGKTIEDYNDVEFFDNPKPVASNVRFFNSDNKPIVKLNAIQELK